MNYLLPVLALLVAALLFAPAVRNNPAWRATVTPLASIIGSGFLVVAPILGHLLGSRAILGMALITGMALAVGWVIRFNIRHAEPLLQRRALPPLALATDRLANLALSLAYVISVAFYLRLLSAFALRGVGLGDGTAADLLTSVILIFIGLVGWWRGLDALERLEEYSVSIKLSVIVALLMGLGVHDSRLGFDLSRVHAAEGQDAWETVRMLAGLLLVVQGFETSRYIGEAYAAELRIRTMRWAQWLSTAIYLVFVLLATPLLGAIDSRLDETAIIDLAAAAAWVLGPMLVLAAIMSQFSAAVADTVGAGGLVEEASGGRISEYRAYPLIAGLAIVLVWSANLFEIISIASRAFALYYLLQSLLALQIARNCHGGIWCRMGLAGVALLLAFVVLFGEPVA